MENRLKDKYVSEVVPALKQKFGYKNINEVPKLDKVVINMGLGDCKDNAKALEAAVGDPCDHRRPEAGRDQGEKVRRQLQGSRGNEHRREGDAARRAHVSLCR